MQIASKAKGLALVVGAIFASATTPTMAHDVFDPYEMVVFSDVTGGMSVVLGKHGRAIEKIVNLPARRKARFETTNNLCVAYAKAGELETAKQVCDAAVEKSATLSTLDQAVALSNRGVLRTVNGDTEGALADLQEAVSLEAGIRAARTNLQRLVATTGGLNAANLSRPVAE